MPFKLEGLTEVQQMLTGYEKQLPYVTMLTLNDLAFDTMYMLKAEVKVKLNLKNQQIPNAFRVKKATKRRLEADVFIDDWKWQAKILKPHFFGGDRAKKGIEKAMIYGGFMSSSEILTPSPGVKIQSSTYVQIMSFLKLNYKAGYDANRNDRSKRKNKSSTQFFIASKKSPKTKHLHPGIYARVVGGVKTKPIMIMRISKKPKYNKIFDIEKTALEVYRKNMKEYFIKNAKLAVRTAR